MFAYLKKYHNSELVFDPSNPIIDEAEFEKKDWTSSKFGHCVGDEILPANMPKARGFGFLVSARVNTNHSGDTTTRISRTRYIAYVNSDPIYWMSKNQNYVEISSFGSEFCAMKHCCEYLRGLRYTLRMMGIKVKGPAHMWGDNQSVLCNTSVPDSTLNNKSQIISYHFVREGVARDEWRTAYVSMHDNPADLLTKVLPMGDKWRGFVRMLQHYIFGSAAPSA